MTHQEKEVNFLLKATGNGYPSHQPSKSEELQPCPFCGGKAQRSLTKVRYDSLLGDPYQDHIVGCFNSNCPVHPAITHCNENCAVTEWNTRHTRQSHQPSKSNEEILTDFAEAYKTMPENFERVSVSAIQDYFLSVLQAKDAELEKVREDALRNVPVGFVRQWINEDLLKEGHDLVTNEDIQDFINIALTKISNEK